MALPAQRRPAARAAYISRTPIFIPRRGTYVYMNPSSAQQMLDRVRGEYLEMPGLSLKLAQIQRLCGVSREACERVLDVLVATKFLRLKSNGNFTRVGDGAGGQGH
jgi:hypothetical protein